MVLKGRPWLFSPIKKLAFRCRTTSLGCRDVQGCAGMWSMIMKHFQTAGSIFFKQHSWNLEILLYISCMIEGDGMGRIKDMRGNHICYPNSTCKMPSPHPEMINLHPACQNIKIQETVGCSPQRRTTELSSGVRISLQQTLGRTTGHMTLPPIETRDKLAF